MRILWITNQPVPEIADSLGITPGVGVGWLNELSRQLAEINTLGLVFPISENMGYMEGYCSSIYYYAIPLNENAVKPQSGKTIYFEKIIRDFQPDVIHIWGTEYLHTYLAVMASKNIGMLEKVVISIQGLVSVYARHFYGHIEGEKIRIPTVKDLYYKSSLERQRKNFILRGKYEKKSIEIVRHVIGRTDWDNACTSQINDEVQYHFCNETLRNSFYQNQWNLETCEKYSLFVSQCHYPLKGFHHALEALSILIKKYPNAHLYTTGRDLTKKNFEDELFDGGYDRHIRAKIRKLHLEGNVTFLGTLNENDMCKQFCKSHVFISASSIENSPNSVGEAMLLGVPVVASDVGGVKNLLVHEQEGFVYQSDAPYMLAYYISKIFDDDELAEKFSINGRKHAKQLYDKEKNLQQIMDIYKKISQDT